MRGSLPRPITWIENPDGCWNCTSHKQGANGYPQLKRFHRAKCLHRHIYEECFGEVPRGMVVRHRCGNRICINPEHLEIGTELENARDKARHGTWVWGERHGHHRLNESSVDFIRQNYRRGDYNKLAVMYGVSKWTIFDILAGRSWTGGRHMSREGSIYQLRIGGKR